MLKGGKGERKKDGNKDALKAVFNMTWQRIHSFDVFSCVRVEQGGGKRTI